MSEENEMVVRPAWKAWAALALAFALGLCVAFLVMRSQNANKPQVTAAAPAVPAVEADPAAADPAAAEPLDIAATFPSWDPASPALAELTAFVADVCDPASPNYREPADRIATFDMDGTIISEKAPYYIDYMMLLYRVLDDPTYEADPNDVAICEEIKTYANRGTKNSDLSPERHRMTASTFEGMKPEDLRVWINSFLDNVPVVGFDGMTYGGSFYKPMIEVINYLKANDFDVYMVSAGEREFVRGIVERLGIEPSHVVACDVTYITTSQGDKAAKDYTMTQDETVVLSTPLTKGVEKNGKVLAIAREIGKVPVLAFGNTAGDYAMLNYAEANGGMGCFVVCDDVEREYGDMAYAQEGYDLVAKEQWTAFSMAEDWATIYGENVVKTELPGAEAEELADAA